MGQTCAQIPRFGGSQLERSARSGHPICLHRVKNEAALQRASSGTWRTLLGLADFASVQSCLSTTKLGIDALDALTMLFTDGPWLPPATAPP
jgi:hypothetical protein